MQASICWVLSRPYGGLAGYCRRVSAQLLPVEHGVRSRTRLRLGAMHILGDATRREQRYAVSTLAPDPFPFCMWPVTRWSRRRIGPSESGVWRLIIASAFCRPVPSVASGWRAACSVQRLPASGQQSRAAPIPGPVPSCPNPVPILSHSTKSLTRCRPSICRPLLAISPDYLQIPTCVPLPSYGVLTRRRCRSLYTSDRPTSSRLISAGRALRVRRLAHLTRLQLAAGPPWTPAQHRLLVAFAAAFTTARRLLKHRCASPA